MKKRALYLAVAALVACPVFAQNSANQGQQQDSTSTAIGVGGGYGAGGTGGTSDQRQQQNSTSGAISSNQGNGAASVSNTFNSTVPSTTTNNVNQNGSMTNNVNQTGDTTNRSVLSGGYVNHDTVEYSGSYKIKNVPSVNGPPLVSSNDTCMGSTSGSANGPGFGIGFGTTWTDSNCKVLKNSREMWNMGMKGAALALMCSDSQNKEALELTGFVCPQTERAQRQAAAEQAAKTPAVAAAPARAPGVMTSSAAPVGWEGADMSDAAIRRRAGMQ